MDLMKACDILSILTPIFRKKKKKQAQNLNALITDLLPYYLIPMKYLKKLRITVYINSLKRIT